MKTVKSFAKTLCKIGFVGFSGGIGRLAVLDESSRYNNINFEYFFTIFFNVNSINKHLMSFFGRIKSAVVVILLSTGIYFVTLNWFSISYGIFGVVILIALMLKRIEPTFLILGNAVFGLIIGILV